MRACGYTCFYLDSYNGLFLALFFTGVGLCLWRFAVVQAAGLDAWAMLSGSRCGEGNVVTFLPGGLP